MSDASDRVLTFLRWFGDGRIDVATNESGPPLYARDLETLAQQREELGRKAIRLDSLVLARDGREYVLLRDVLDLLDTGGSDE